MNTTVRQTWVALLLAAAVLAIFVLRAVLAAQTDAPRLFHLFDMLTVAGSAAALLCQHTQLKLADWLLAAALGGLVGVGMLFASLYSPYPFLGLVRSNAAQAGLRGVFTFLACLGGLASMRQGGPVPLHLANREMGRAGQGILLGLMVGAPLAVLNVFALTLSEGQAVSWQSPLASLLDALQPAVMEEVVYRFALWGLLWRVLRDALPERAVWYSGALALVIHNFAHFDELFVQAPLAAIGMGLATLILWGLPPTLLARRRGLESAIAFHWIQDVARFLAGF